MNTYEPLAEQLKLDEPYLCLDFANTVNWRNSPHPEDTLHGYADLVRWAEGVALLTSGQAGALLARAEAQPEDAQAVFQRAVALREAVFHSLSAVAGGKTPAPADLEPINRELSAALNSGELTPTSTGFTLQWKTDAARLDGFLPPIARSVADLLTTGDLDRVGICPGEDGCGWLFYDTSRNHSRHWCSMGSCGNRAKAKRYYRKEKIRD